MDPFYVKHKYSNVVYLPFFKGGKKRDLLLACLKMANLWRLPTRLKHTHPSAVYCHASDDLGLFAWHKYRLASIIYYFMKRMGGSERIYGFHYDKPWMKDNSFLWSYHWNFDFHIPACNDSSFYLAGTLFDGAVAGTSEVYWVIIACFALKLSLKEHFSLCEFNCCVFHSKSH